jgi:hypothetical protein
MKKTATLFFLLFVTTMWSQAKIYEFESIDMIRPDGWEIQKTSGEIQIDEKSKTITFITTNYVFTYDIFSKQEFFKVGSYLYNAYDWRGEIIRIKIDKIDEYSKYLDFYYYSDETDMVLFRLCLIKCPNKT